VQLEEEAAGIAQNGTYFVSSPEGSSRSGAVLARWLCGFTVVSSHCRHGDDVGEVVLLSRDCAISENSP
jgi:hypothetical protein